MILRASRSWRKYINFDVEVEGSNGENPQRRSGDDVDPEHKCRLPNHLKINNK